MMKYFAGCTALITGASSGIGREIASQLAPFAETLILVARNLEALEAVKMDLVSKYPRVRVVIYPLDLRDGKALDAFVLELKEKELCVNFLVNNAGHGDYGNFESADWAKIESMITLNITALTQLTHRLIPMLKKLTDSAILNVSSTAGFLPLPQLAVYAASKAYVTSFSEALRIELRHSGISVTTLCPGPIHTGFGKAARRRPEDQSGTPEFLRVPLGAAVRETLEAVVRGRARIIPGWKVAAVAAVVAVMPMILLRFCLSKKMTNDQ